jgi:hypothetical protein
MKILADQRSLPWLCAGDNRQQGAHNVNVRLDRSFANGGFLDFFFRLSKYGMCKPLSLTIVV